MGAAIQPQPFGKYFLLERIATGGMAEIFKAKYRAEAGFEKTLVIKRILPHLAQDEEFVQMFRNEASLTVRLNHANIVQVFDFGRFGEDYFLAMEYVRGQNLRAVMKRCQELGAPVPIPFALFAAVEVAKALNYAHSRHDDADDTALGIVHRDVTPANILVSYEGEIKIADFGIAKAATRASGTQAGTIKGKASYLSPEQVMGTPSPVDGRADLFALGAVLWEMLVGRKLFSGDADFEIMSKITTAPVLKPSQMNAAVPAEIDRVVMKALERDREARYANAGALQKDLTVLLQQFGGSVTTVDISAFLRRLFRKEVEAEKEASKSLRMPVIEDPPSQPSKVAEIAKAASDGATMVSPYDNTSPGAPARKLPPTGSTPPSVRAPLDLAVSRSVPIGRTTMAPPPVSRTRRLGVLAVLGLSAWAGAMIAVPSLRPGFLVTSPTPKPRSTVVARSSPVGTVAVVASPVIPATAAPTSTAEPTPVVTAVASTAATPKATKAPRATPTPRRTAAPVSTRVATATAAATPVTGATQEYGFLWIRFKGEGWALVYMDGAPLMDESGEQVVAPRDKIRVPVGKHTFRLVNPETRQEKTYSGIVVTRDGDGKPAARLDAEPFGSVQ